MNNIIGHLHKASVWPSLQRFHKDRKARYAYIYVRVCVFFLYSISLREVPADE